MFKTTGSPICEGFDTEGWRQSLDGRNLYAGDEIEIAGAGWWLPGQYQCDAERWRGLFATRIFDSAASDVVSFLILPSMRLRWPPKHVDQDLRERLIRIHLETIALHQFLLRARQIANHRLGVLDHPPPGAETMRLDIAREALESIRDLLGPLP